MSSRLMSREGHDIGRILASLTGRSLFGGSRFYQYFVPHGTMTHPNIKFYAAVVTWEMKNNQAVATE